MMYTDIAVPTEGDGSRFTLIGSGYYRGQRLAAVHYRIMAAAIDAAIFWAVAMPGVLLGNSGIEALSYMLAATATFFNVVWMQGRTGQSFGKMCLGMVVVSPRVEPMNVASDFLALVKAPMLAFRTVVHLLDLVLFLGLILIVFTQRRESLADKVCNTLVLRPHDLSTIDLHTGRIGARDRT